MNWYKKAGDITDPKRVVLPENSFSKEELISAIRQSIMAEQDAIILYETFAHSTNNQKAKELLLDIADEEKVHVGELQELLEQIAGDKEKDKIEEGREEAIEHMGKKK